MSGEEEKAPEGEGLFRQGCIARRRCLSSTFRGRSIQPGQTRVKKWRQVFIPPDGLGEGAQGRGKPGGVVWLHGEVSEWSDVDADGEQNIAGMRQTAEGLSFDAQPDAVSGILRRDVGTFSTAPGRLKKGRVVHQSPVESPDGPLDFQPVKKLVHGAGELFRIAGNRRMNRVEWLANFVR